MEIIELKRRTLTVASASTDGAASFTSIDTAAQASDANPHTTKK